MLQVGKIPVRGKTGTPGALSGTRLEIQPGQKSRKPNRVLFVLRPARF